MPWTQIGGDIDPGASGGTIATADGSSIELLKIQPVRNNVGDEEAADVGFPFWTKEAYFDLSDLDLKNKDVQRALQYTGFTEGDQKFWFEEEATPTQRALVIAEALLDYGRGDEGPSGWSKDLPDIEVKWNSGKVATLPEYVADEDKAFKDDVLGYSDIRSKLEEMVQEMADQSAAQAWSTPGDQLVIDLEAEGYDPKSVVSVAEFGDAVAVNGDLETDKTSASVEAELEAQGYEVTDKGGRIPAQEDFAYAEHVIRAVAREMDLPEETVEEAAKGLDWWQEEIPSDTSGYGSIWAKKAAGGGAEEARRRPAPRARRRRS
jgi:hypothetical protein